jgi:hypothetical protein
MNTQSIRPRGLGRIHKCRIILEWCGQRRSKSVRAFKKMWHAILRQESKDAARGEQ